MKQIFCRKSFLDNFLLSIMNWLHRIILLNKRKIMFSRINWICSKKLKFRSSLLIMFGTIIIKDKRITVIFR